MPKPPRRTNIRITLTQKRIPSYVRYSTVKYPSDLSVNVHQVTEWGRCMPNLKFVKEILDKYPLIMDEAYLRGRLLKCEWKTIKASDYRYNFIIPHDLVQSLQATFSAHPADTIRLSAEEKTKRLVLDMVVTIDPKLRMMSRDFVNSMTGFNSVKGHAKNWVDDIKWLERDRNKVDVSYVGLFADEVSTSGLSHPDVLLRHQELASQIIPKVRTARLRTNFQLNSQRIPLQFDQVVGHLCRDKYLNDTVIGQCIEFIADEAKNCFAMSSLVTSTGWPTKMPSRSIVEIGHVMPPVNLNRNHWGIIIVKLKHTSSADSRANAYLYEPLIGEDYRDELEKIYEDLKKFITRWHKNSLEHRGSLKFASMEWILTPQQPDWTSCGVFIIAQTYNILHDNIFRHQSVSEADIAVMRLRIMWILTVRSVEIPMNREDKIRARETHKRLCESLAGGKEIPW